jgi:CheY-like chemotaxis protein
MSAEVWSSRYPRSESGALRDSLREVQILLVEDSLADARLTARAVDAWSVPTSLAVARDGDEALTLLRKKAAVASRLPDLILLDLNLPTLHGFEVLESIKADEQLRQIPVVVLTTSDDGDDVRRAYSLYANCYIVKPSSLSEFMAAVKSIEDFWLRIARLPDSI